MNNNVLVILASGKSSRFGGYPKAFCQINGKYIVQKTVDLARTYFTDIYLVINNEISNEYRNVIKGCKIFSINTGQGDAHSFLRAARLIRANCSDDRITLCWGDTLYLNDNIFKKASESFIEQEFVGASLCAIDYEPYAWYEIDDKAIRKACFRDRDGIIEKGIHDQSVFVFKHNTICNQLETYMSFLQIDDNEDYINGFISKEMKLLDSFSFFYENKMLPMKYSLVESGQCYSFNTYEELENIKKVLTTK